MGYPSPDEMHALFMAIQNGGADILEIGIPFSDPIADGPTIQATSKEALDQGMTLTRALSSLKKSRAKGFHMPVVFMGYANPFYAFGLGRLGEALKNAGVSGVIVPDLPPSEASEFIEALVPFDIDPIFFIAPTTPYERMKSICEASRGFIYCISSTGVTGSATTRGFSHLRPTVESIREFSNLPICVGFGISTKEQIESVCEISDGAIMASKLLDDMKTWAKETRPENLERAVREYKSATKPATKAVSK